eukprot:IDg6493t1
MPLLTESTKRAANKNRNMETAKEDVVIIMEWSSTNIVGTFEEVNEGLKGENQDKSVKSTERDVPSESDCQKMISVEGSSSERWNIASEVKRKHDKIVADSIAAEQAILSADALMNSFKKTRENGPGSV